MWWTPSRFGDDFGRRSRAPYILLSRRMSEAPALRGWLAITSADKTLLSLFTATPSLPRPPSSSSRLF